MAARDFTMTVNVRLDRVFELKCPKGARRTYILVNNTSAAGIKFEWGTTPSPFLGEALTAGSRMERVSPACPQNTLYIVGTLLTDQIIDVGQGFEG